MSIDKIKIYLTEFIFIIFLSFILFLQTIYKTIYLSIFLILYMFLLKKIIKKRNIISIYKKQISLLMILFGFIYLIIFYSIGFYFNFYLSSIKFGKIAILYYIIPYTIIIYSKEVIREIYIIKKEKLIKILLFLSFIIIDLIIYGQIYNLSNLDDLLIIVGFIIFSSISNNLLFNYISIRYGKNSIIFYNLITTLYPFIIPYTPNVYILFRTFFKIIYPYFLYLFLEYTYSKTNLIIPYKDKIKEIVKTSIFVMILSIITMLISCKFKYGILVIGSKSMSGTLNMGDAILFEKYKNQIIEKNDIIVFKKNNLKIIHRVIDKREVNGKVRYYTKGDANLKMDSDYLLDLDIIGISKLKLKYIGYPSIWVKKIF